MEFKAKPDWEECKERYKLWWAHEDFGRAGIQVSAPKRVPGSAKPPKPLENPADRWTDVEYAVSSMNFTLENTFYGGEAFPVWSAGYPGWDGLATFLGCDVTLDADTGWCHPVIDEGELSQYDPAAIDIDPGNRWYKLSEEYRDLTLKESFGRAVPTTGAFGGSGDTLAAIRSTKKLLLDLYESPEAVEKFEARMMEIWISHYGHIHEKLKEAAQGSAGWFELWSPGKFYAAQCDFAYMISPAFFERFFLPAIKTQTEYLDHSVYHVDGLGNYNHVDLLCGLPNLQALQILPGTGKPSPLHYGKVLKKVQDAGKNLHISISPGEVAAALDMLDSRGLMIHTYAATQDEAEDLIRYTERNSR